MGACKEAPIPPPVFELTAPNIDLNNIKSDTKGQIVVRKSGIGNIDYTVVADKPWLILEKKAGSLKTDADTIKFSLSINNTGLLEGQNTANVTFTPTINGVLSSAISMNITGIFKISSLKAKAEKIELGTIKKSVNARIEIVRTGLEKVSYTVSSDKPFLTLNQTQNLNFQNELDSIVCKIDPKGLPAGPFSAIVRIEAKINEVLQEPINVLISGIFDNTLTGDISAHVLSEDEIWSGNINLLGSITVPIGRNLTIKPGTRVSIKSTVEPIKLTINGSLKAEGTDNGIIEFKSELNKSNKDWVGIIVNGKVEFKFVYIRNAANAISFEFQKLDINTLNSSIKNVFFDKNIVGIFDHKANSSAVLSYLSFRNIELFGIRFASGSQTTVEYSEFLSDLCYIDLAVASNSGKYVLKDNNFAAKKLSYLSHLEFLEGFKNNQISASRNYNLSIVNGSNILGNAFTANEVRNFQNSNIGCGFRQKY
jgi:hypothetical protein